MAPLAGSVMTLDPIGPAPASVIGVTGLGIPGKSRVIGCGIPFGVE